MAVVAAAAPAHTHTQYAKQRQLAFINAFIVMRCGSLFILSSRLAVCAVCARGRRNERLMKNKVSYKWMAAVVVVAMAMVMVAENECHFAANALI